MRSGMLNQMPPRASIMLMKPAKLTTINASIVMFDIFSTVDFTHAIPGAISRSVLPPSAP